MHCSGGKKEFWCALFMGKKGSTKINLLGAETAGWNGRLPLEGVVGEKFVPPSKVCLRGVSKEGTWDVPEAFARMSWRRSKSLCQKLRWAQTRV